MKTSRITGEEVVKKILPLLIDEDRDNSNYMSKYMRYKRKHEKIGPPIKKQLENEAETLLKNIKKAMEIS